MVTGMTPRLMGLMGLRSLPGLMSISMGSDGPGKVATQASVRPCGFFPTTSPLLQHGNPLSPMAYWVGRIGSGQRCSWPLNIGPLGDAATRGRALEILNWGERGGEIFIECLMSLLRENR
jgi:hypothetical protein